MTKGQQIIVTIDGAVVAACTGNSFSGKAELKEISGMSAWREYQVLQTTWSVTSRHLIPVNDNTADTIAGKKVLLLFADDSGKLSIIGNAIVGSKDIGGEIRQNASLEYKFQGTSDAVTPSYRRYFITSDPYIFVTAENKYLIVNG